MPKVTETVLEINLKNLKQNLEFLKSKIKPETKFLAVVKAFGYGSDSVEISKYLEKSGVDYFAVAYTTEGITLRNAGIKTPILVLHPLPSHFKEIVEYNLEPNLYNRKVLTEFIECAKKLSQINFPIHIKFNTGLNRLGFREEHIEFISQQVNSTDAIKIQSVFSHLVASEDLNEKYFTLNQIEKFKTIAAKLSGQIGYTPVMHQLNTSGILNYANEGQFDMVRSGIGLYGYGNDTKHNECLKPIATLKTVISQIHYIEKGESVGYNRAFIARQPVKTATLPIGHADGIGRQYGNGKGFVTIHGKKAYIIGNVCMDMLMVDITGIECEEGDEVIIFGENITAEDLAATADTISYELITDVSHRIKRVFLR
ncbi:alanine racemase [Abyssalbus ytuae]|uniref:Alanine racemase n=1 Tax=Abyssalbus ytuae TaxID=2926907 RepID=A0A9E6ZUQ2_9FLAO|nr:alanine racemase [Abyssalbus ytuae]UOB19278.1 alanine racemase [Abyssalbus ytuae]